MKSTKHINDGKRPGTPIVKSTKPQPSKLDVTPKKSNKTDETILETIPKEYFDGPANVMDHVLKILPEDNAHLNDWFENELHETERAFDIISEKLHNSVMENLNSFVDGLGEVITLGKDLQLCNILAKNGRRSINSAKDDILMGGLHTLAKYKRKKGYQAFLKVLLGVRYLVGVGKSLDRALDSMDYPQALQICYDCKNMLPQFQDINALKPITDKLKNQFSTIEERLDSSLTEICRTFNGAAYERILIAYFVLSRGPKAIEQLKMNFTEMVNSAAKNVVYSHALLSESNAMQAETLKRSAKFRDLCASVPANQYMPCFQTILEVLSDIMFAHYTIYQWHAGVSTAHAELDHELVDEEREKIEYFDSIKDSLIQIKPGVWDNIQNKVAVFLSGIQLTVFKIDEFLRIWNQLNIFMEIGEEFSGSDSNSLRTTLKHVSKTYFTAYHKSKLETLRTMLENDAWAKCPVSKRFQVKFVYERELQNFVVPPQLEMFRQNREKYKSVFLSFENDGNPFSVDYKGLNNRPVVLRMNTFEELLVDPNEDATDSTNDSEDEPMITTTAINIIRWLGSYMKIIQELQPIAFEVFQGIIQIVEYFIYVVFSFFGEESEEMPLVLKAMIYKFRKSFGEAADASPMLSPNADKTGQIKVPKLYMVDTVDPNTLFGLSYITVAYQSLLFLQEAMNALKSDLVEHLPKAQREKNLNDFYANTVDSIPELVTFMYHTLAFKFVDYKQLAEMIEKTKWDTKELGAENSPYVEEYDNFAKRLARAKEMGTVPPKIQNIIWDQTLKVTMEQLVDAYAKIKKCTNEGRAIMSLDSRTFQSSVQKMCPIKPIPHTQYVEAYIKAFYISTESDFLNWCKDHTEYSLKQLLSLANVGIGTTMKKAARTTLLQHIEEVDKVRKRAAAVQQ